MADMENGELSPQAAGGFARAAALTSKERRDIASKAARARWHTKRKLQVITVHDYGQVELNRLAVAQTAFEEMTSEERLRAFIWFKSKYSKEWPSDYGG